MKTRALVVSDVNTVTVCAVDVPAPGAGELLVETAFSCISPGTELRCLRGQQAGAPAMPFIPGYAMAGTVVACGPGTHLPVGTRVFCGGTAHANINRCWGAHIGHAVQCEPDLLMVPDSLDLRTAAVCRLAAIAWRGVRMSAPQPGETAVVVGLGPIGLFCARILHLHGARVLGVDRLAARVRLLACQNIQGAVLDGSVAATVQRVLPDGADIVFEATGVPAVAREIVQLGHSLPWDDREPPATRFVLQASYAGDLALDYQTLFEKEATVLVPRHHKPHDLCAVFAAVARGALPVEDVISAVHAPDDAPAVYQRLREAPAEIMTALFQWQ